MRPYRGRPPEQIGTVPDEGISASSGRGPTHLLHSPRIGKDNCRHGVAHTPEYHGCSGAVPTRDCSTSSVEVITVACYQHVEVSGLFGKGKNVFVLTSFVSECPFLALFT